MIVFALFIRVIDNYRISGDKTHSGLAMAGQRWPADLEGSPNMRLAVMGAPRHGQGVARSRRRSRGAAAGTEVGCAHGASESTSSLVDRS